MLYCDLSDTGRTFKSKKIYKCHKCGLEAGLDSPDANIICFAKTNEAHISSMSEANEVVKEARKNDKLLHEYENRGNFPPEHMDPMFQNSQQPIDSSPEYLELDEYGKPKVAISSASTEQINQRMDICNSCEYYKNESCILCGCRVVRNSVYQNKLADKNARCPDGKWGPIKD
jgi:hypothetical protein